MVWLDQDGAVGRTRTGMGYPIRPSNVRVYQFHHDGTLLGLSGIDRGSSGRLRSRRGRCLGGSCLGRHAARPNDGRLGPGLQDGQRESENDESDESCGRQFVQDRRRSARAKGGLSPSAAERAGDVCSPPLLDKHDQDQKEADEHVENDDRNVQNAQGILPRKGRKCICQPQPRQDIGRCSDERTGGRGEWGTGGETPRFPPSPRPPVSPSEAVVMRDLTETQGNPAILANEAGSRLAPPIKNPSTPALVRISDALEGVTEPP